MSKATRKERPLWFRAKNYGWGWYPVTWQGWLITAGYAASFTISFLIFGAWAGAATEAGADLRETIFGVLEFGIVLGLLSYSLYRVCSRFGEKPGWRWGKK